MSFQLVIHLSIFVPKGGEWEQVEDMSERFPDEEKNELEKMRLSRENLSGR